MNEQNKIAFSDRQWRKQCLFSFCFCSMSSIVHFLLVLPRLSINSLSLCSPLYLLLSFPSINFSRHHLQAHLKSKYALPSTIEIERRRRADKMKLNIQSSREFQPSPIDGDEARKTTRMNVPLGLVSFPCVPINGKSTGTETVVEKQRQPVRRTRSNSIRIWSYRCERSARDKKTKLDKHLFHWSNSVDEGARNKHFFCFTVLPDFIRAL